MPLSWTFCKPMHFHAKEVQENFLSHMANMQTHCLLFHVADLAFLCKEIVSCSSRSQERGPGGSTRECVKKEHPQPGAAGARKTPLQPRGGEDAADRTACFPM